MRLLEIASATEQIALFRLVTNSVWQALDVQQKQQAEQKAAEKLKPKRPRSSAVKIPTPPLPKPFPKPVQQQPQRAPVQTPVKQQQQMPVQNRDFALKPTDIPGVNATKNLTADTAERHN